MERSEVSSVIFLNHFDRHVLHDRPILRQAHLLSDHLDVRPQLQQPMKRSPHLDFLLEGIY